MKFLTVAVLLSVLAGGAFAVECAEGVRRAGCVGPRGAVEVNKPVVAEPKEVVVAPKKEVVVEAAPKPKALVVTAWLSSYTVVPDAVVWCNSRPSV